MGDTTILGSNKTKGKREDRGNEPGERARAFEDVEKKRNQLLQECLGDGEERETEDTCRK